MEGKGRRGSVTTWKERGHRRKQVPKMAAAAATECSKGSDGFQEKGMEIGGKGGGATSS
jgi:hypothetical protein